MLLRFSAALKEHYFQRKKLYFYLERAIHNLFPQCVFYTIIQFSSVAQSCPTLCDPITFFYMCTYILTHMHLVRNTHMKNLA